MPIAQCRLCVFSNCDELANVTMTMAKQCLLYELFGGLSSAFFRVQFPRPLARFGPTSLQPDASTGTRAILWNLIREQVVRNSASSYRHAQLEW